MKILTMLKLIFVICILYSEFSCCSSNVICTPVKIICPPNRDAQYNRYQILNLFASVINEETGISIHSVDTCGVVSNFFVFDLVDTSNNTEHHTCIQILNKHVYHFSSIGYKHSLSNIAFMEDGRTIIFKSINCPMNSDSLQTVIRYLNESLDNEGKSDILLRVQEYRKYGYYFATDQYDSVITDCKK